MCFIKNRLFCLILVITIQFIVTFIPVFSCGEFAQGAVIFQDNFDSSCTGTQCYSSGGVSSYPVGWNQWYFENNQPITLGGVSHHGGEITSPGRGGIGKSLKIWRYGSAYPGYTGGLLKTLSSTSRNLFIRWYMKIPSDMRMNGCIEYQKLWRFDNSSGHCVYLNINEGWQRGQMQIYDDTEWVTILNNTQTAALMDGEWHCIEVQLGLDRMTLNLWVDGVLRYNNTSKNWHANTNGVFNNYLQHFGFGNRGSTCSWQESWRAIEFDDLIIADTYIGPDGGVPTPLPSPTSLNPPSGLRIINQ